MQLVFTSDVLFFESMVNRIMLDLSNDPLLFASFLFFTVLLSFFLFGSLFLSIYISPNIAGNHDLPTISRHEETIEDSIIKKSIFMGIIIFVLIIAKMFIVMDNTFLVYYGNYHFRIDRIENKIAYIKVFQEINTDGVKTLITAQKEIKCQLTTCQSEIKGIINKYEQDVTKTKSLSAFLNNQNEHNPTTFKIIVKNDKDVNEIINFMKDKFKTKIEISK